MLQYLLLLLPGMRVNFISLSRKLTSLPCIVTGHLGQRVTPVKSPVPGYGEATGQQQWWIGLQADDLFTRQWLEFQGPS